MSASNSQVFGPYAKGEFAEGLPCVRCGAKHDPLMDRPALQCRGHNPSSGILFRCHACDEDPVEAEWVTGKSFIELLEEDFKDFEPNKRRQIHLTETNDE